MWLEVKVSDAFLWHPTKKLSELYWKSVMTYSNTARAHCITVALTLKYSRLELYNYSLIKLTLWFSEAQFFKSLILSRTFFNITSIRSLETDESILHKVFKRKLKVLNQTILDQIAWKRPLLIWLCHSAHELNYADFNTCVIVVIVYFSGHNIQTTEHRLKQKVGLLLQVKWN